MQMNSMAEGHSQVGSHTSNMFGIAFLHTIIIIELVLYLLLGAVLHVPSLLLIASKKKGDAYTVTPPPPSTLPPTSAPLPETTPTWLAYSDPSTSPAPVTTCIATPCGVCAEISSTSGTITSPNYPESYGSFLDCKYIIRAPEGMKIHLTFTKFIIEREYDVISVFDGDNIVKTDTIIRTLTGGSLPVPITSTDNVLTVKFTTDANNVMIPPDVVASWRATYVVV